MNYKAKSRLFDELHKKIILEISDIEKAGIENEEYVYVEFGEYTVRGFTTINDYFKMYYDLGTIFLDEVESNKYLTDIDYQRYLADNCKEIELFIHDFFPNAPDESFYKNILKVVFNNNRYNYTDSRDIESIDKKNPCHLILHEFSKRLQDLLVALLKELNNRHSIYKGEKEDTRIACPASKEQIEEYIYQLNMENKSGDQILTKDEIYQFLQANFQGFNELGERQFLNPKGLTAADIRYFIYVFIIRFDPNGDRRLYAQLCKDNFIQFKASEIHSITSNFAKKPKKYFLD